jgi:hypothetical protein
LDSHGCMVAGSVAASLNDNAGHVPTPPKFEPLFTWPSRGHPGRSACTLTTGVVFWP